MKKLGIIVCLSALTLTVTLLLTNAAELSPTDVNLGISANTTPETNDWTAAKAAYARWQENGTATPAEKEMISEYLQHGRTRTNGNRLDNTGGPDAFGYSFVDNVAPDTATYSWIELRGMGGTTWINNFSGHDDGSANVTLPFSFPFYGGSYNTVNVITNGNLQFVTSGTDFTNECLPTTTLDGPVICLFWEDLHLDNGGIPSGTDVVGWRDFGTYVVIEYDSIGYYSDPGSVKMEVILYDDGRIKMQYNLFGGGAPTSSSTVGIQQAGSGTSLEYLCDGSGFPVVAGRAIWFYTSTSAAHDFSCTNVINPTPGEVSPGQSINVSAEFTNLGTTTESSPVKYRLDNGAIVSETTAPLANGQSETHAFATPAIMPGSGRHTLHVWSDLATDEDRTNDTVSVSLHVGCADYSVAAPGVWSGSTCGEGNDCDQRASTEVIYEVTIPQSGLNWNFTTCDAVTDFDSYLILMSACCGGTTIASNDDNCSLAGHGLNSTFASGILDAGLYYLVLEAFGGSECGNYALSIQPDLRCVPCEVGDLIEIVEDPSDTTYYLTDPNGGCNSSPDQFGNINFNQTVCGLGFFYDGPGGADYRDTDWYSFTVAQAETVTVTYWSDFAKQVAIVNYGDCSNIQLLINVQTDVLCDYEYAFAYLPAGTYALFFAPTFAAGIFTISDSMHYRATLHHGTLAVDDNVALYPSSFSLSAYPNPFNPETRISFALPRAADVKLAVYDVTGRLVSTLAQQRYEAGTHDVRFNGADLPSGIYFARMEAGDFSTSQKMVLLK